MQKPPLLKPPGAFREPQKPRNEIIEAISVATLADPRGEKNMRKFWAVKNFWKSAGENIP